MLQVFVNNFIFFFNFFQFQDQLNVQDLDDVVKAANIIQADERNKKKGDYIISVFYDKAFVPGDEPLPRGFTYKIVSAVGYKAGDDLVKMVEAEINAQPKTEHVIFIQHKDSKMDISPAIEAAGKHARKLFVSFNFVKDQAVNKSTIGSLSHYDRVGAFDTRHNTSTFYIFQAATRFSISQRAIDISATGASTIIMPNQNSTGRGRGQKRRGGGYRGANDKRNRRY